MKNALTVIILLALMLPSQPTAANPIISPVIQVTKAIAKKVYSRFKGWFRTPSKFTKLSNFPDDIRLTFHNGGERFIRYAKNLKPRTKGLTARAGKDVAAVLCNKKLTRIDKIKVLNAMKAKKYLADSGGIDSYKALNRDARKILRGEATEFMNGLIEQSTCSSIRLTNQSL